MVSYDLEKSRRNLRERGLSFDRADDFEWTTAKIVVDDRRDYGEPRFVATDSSTAGCTSSSSRLAEQIFA